MIEDLIGGFLGCFSVVMLVAAFVLAALCRWLCSTGPRSTVAEQLLCWVLLLSVGVQGIFTFIGHVFFPANSAAHIGWAVSPFQYEVGIADLTGGVLGLIAFRADFGFRLAASIAAIIWYGGDAVGHVRQMIVAHNYAPGNAGPWFWTDVLIPMVLVACLIAIWRRKLRAE
jgi:hypothetical protein